MKRSSLLMCVSCGLESWVATERLANWGDHPHAQKVR